MTIALALIGLLEAAAEGDVKEIRRLIRNGFRKPESGRRRRHNGFDVGGG